MEFKQLWTDLPIDVRQQFESQSQTIDLKRGDYLYREGDQPKGIYFIKSGLVGLVITGASSGKEHLLRFFRQGQFFGHRALFSSEGYHGSSVVLEPTTIKLVPQRTIMEALERHPSLLNEVVKTLAKELRQCETQHVMILENEILPRVAQSLVYLKELHPDHNWTRQEIANFCASTVSTVIKAMTELENMNLISQDGRSVKILDRDGLISLQDRT